VGVPSVLPTLTRRRLLLGALPATLAFGVLGSATACAPAPPPADLADLRTQFERAHADSNLATEAAAAATARPQLVAALATVASERSEHAAALADEITRMTDGEAPTTSTLAPTTTTAEAPTTPTADDVAQALRASAADAAQLAARLSGYRAGLLGSIAAACTASYQVALGNPGQAR
jgi:hypothetical protein